MKFVVMSRRDAVQYSYVAHMESSVIISICDSYSLFPKFKRMKSNGIKAVLNLSFDDVQLPSGASERYIWKKDEGLLFDTLDNSPYVVISEEDAKNIVSFVKKWYNKVDTIIVHCNAGISRSSGVCAAIMKGMTGDDSQIFDNPKYVPNTTCYKVVLEEFMKEKE